ncbi:MAG: sortase [Candidatus Pacebacteria bacterium]|nr:sortase [Candidatus Paceibacterota bacterium]MDD5356617.1 sortase [Candidatus Paceibacterota bacterium]
MSYQENNIVTGSSFKNKLLFLGIFFAVFFVSFGILYALGFIPLELAPTNEEPSLPSPTESVSVSGMSPAPTASMATGEEPIRIKIPNIGVDSPIRNPSTTDIDALDNELLKGVVHYPGSGYLGQGNMFLFGHGSNLPVIHNQAFKVFTQIKTLKQGDVIHVLSQTKDYSYTVSKVTLVDASKVLVEFSTQRKMLTLSTCDTFGTKQQRYVVEADFSGSTDL